MAFDILNQTIRQGFLLLPDETALDSAFFRSFLAANKNSLPPGCIFLLKSVGNNEKGRFFLGIFSGMDRAKAPVRLVGYDKPAVNALQERGGDFPFAVITADRSKAAVYASVSTAKRHQTILISGETEFVLVPAATPSQSIATTQGMQLALAAPNVVFNYMGDSKAKPPEKGEAIPTGCLADEVGMVFVGTSGRRYQATRFVDEGASGVIYACDAPEYVIKHFLPNQLFRTEQEKLRLLCKTPLKHPNIIWPQEMLSLTGKDGKTYRDVGYVMPFCPYKSLQGILKAQELVRRFPTKEVLLQAMIDLCDAFDYCLRANIVNGDIKIKNIVYDDKKRVPYIVDMDAVQVDKYINRMGTNGYLPIEVYKRAGGGNFEFYRKKHSDYFAVSSLLFIMFVGMDAPYRAEGQLDDASMGRLTCEANFPFKGTESQISSRVPPGSFVRWCHLPSFIREAFIDTFDKTGKHFLPDKRYTPADWANMLRCYLKMVRNPKSQLAKLDPDYYAETAPILKKGGGGLADIPLSRLTIKMEEVEERTAVSTSALGAVHRLVGELKLHGIDEPSAVAGLLSLGKYKSGPVSFELKTNLPFLKTVLCKVVR